LSNRNDIDNPSAIKGAVRLNEKERLFSFFRCLKCDFRADGDYVGALNVAGEFLAEGMRESPGMANPLTYMAGGSPLGDPYPEAVKRTPAAQGV
jgi:transposase